MTSLKKLVGALALIGAVTGAQAASINNLDGTNSFSGFDWDKFGAALISGYDLTAAQALGTTDNFTLTYQSFATAVYDANGNVLGLSNLRQGTGSGYEYTIVATVNEQAQLIGTDGTTGLATLKVLGGTYNIYYQAVGDVDRAAGTGYQNGTSILSGTILASGPGGSSTVVAGQGLSNPGDNSLSPSLKATVDAQNLAFVSPILSNSKATTTLQFESFIDNGFIRPGEIGGIAVAPLNTNTTFVAQADGNQSFGVPEPTSAALLGIALAGLGFSSRRNKSK